MDVSVISTHQNYYSEYCRLWLYIQLSDQLDQHSHRRQRDRISLKSGK